MSNKKNVNMIQNKLERINSLNSIFLPFLAEGNKRLRHLSPVGIEPTLAV